MGEGQTSQTDLFAQSGIRELTEDRTRELRLRLVTLDRGLPDANPCPIERYRYSLDSYLIISIASFTKTATSSRAQILKGSSMVDYTHAMLSLQENLKRLDGKPDPDLQALWNISNAMLVMLDALQVIHHKVEQLELP